VLLSDRDIRKEIDSGRVKLEPYAPELIQPSSIDVRMDRYFRVFENHRYPHIDPAVEQPELTRLIETRGEDPFVLHPGEFVLASTYEVVTLPDDVAGRLEGKSSLGRLGLLTHSTAGWIDPGFSGHVTLELSNVATLPIKLCSGPAPRPSTRTGRPSTAPVTRTSAAPLRRGRSKTSIGPNCNNEAPGLRPGASLYYMKVAICKSVDQETNRRFIS
jgi:dCTP deaminase